MASNFRPSRSKARGDAGLRLPDFADHFGFFLPLAGISTVRQIRENAFDIKATGRLNRLYIELLKDNPEWATAARREDLNHFMARVIFCFFAEDTASSTERACFTATVEKMSARDSSNTHEVISELFRAMNIPVRRPKRGNQRPLPGSWHQKLGNRIPLRERRPVLRQRGRAEVSAKSPAPTCSTSAISTGRRSIPTSSAR
jgi:hypothetical protein